MTTANDTVEKEILEALATLSDVQKRGILTLVRQQTLPKGLTATEIFEVAKVLSDEFIADLNASLEELNHVDLSQW